MCVIFQSTLNRFGVWLLSRMEINDRKKQQAIKHINNHRSGLNTRQRKVDCNSFVLVKLREFPLLLKCHVANKLIPLICLYTQHKLLRIAEKEKSKGNFFISEFFIFINLILKKSIKYLFSH